MKKILLGLTTCALFACSSASPPTRSNSGDASQATPPDMGTSNPGPDMMDTEPHEFVEPDDCGQCYEDAQDKMAYGPCAAALSACQSDDGCEKYLNCYNDANTRGQVKRCDAARPAKARQLWDALDLCLNDACPNSCGSYTIGCEQCLQADDSAACQLLDTQCGQIMTCKSSLDCYDNCDFDSDTTEACVTACDMSKDADYTKLEACLQDECVMACAADDFTTYACDSCVHEFMWGNDMAKACAGVTDTCAKDMYCKQLFDCRKGCHSDHCRDACDTAFDDLENQGVAANQLMAAESRFNAIFHCGETNCTAACSTH